MASVDSLELAQACPAEETLIGFNLGKLSATEEEAIVTHIASCTRCESILQKLNQEPPHDSLLKNVRRCFASESVLEESACAELEAYARRLSLGSTEPSFSTEALARTTGPHQTWIGRKIDNYLIMDVIGQGGMGVVFEARQETVNHVVALKMVQGGVWANPKTVRRFRTEGEAIARLRHPHVVQIYHFGEHDGLPFFSMELLKGGTLARRLSKGPLEPRAAAEFVAQLSDAVQFAHQNHVIHRDLKPSNVLLDANGSPKISDFGLAKLLDAEEGDTRSQEILGTPAYMAPEQAEGKAADIGPTTDIYALGVILYEALTGRPPFRGPDRLGTLALILNGKLVPPSQYRKELHEDLEAICIKCLQRQPGARYGSAGSVAEDLRRWLKGEVTEARPIRWTGRIARVLWRYRIATAVMIVCLAVLPLLTPDPDRPLRQNEADLLAGKSVELVKQEGKPSWFRIANGAASAHLSIAQDGSWRVRTYGMCMIDLLPDPVHENYRFRAEVRHEDAHLRGETGIYVAHQSLPGLTEGVHVCVAMGYNDVFVPSEHINVQGLLAGLKKQQPSPKASVRFSPQFYCDTGERTHIWHTTGGVPGLTFGPAHTQPRWRQLEFLVTSTEIKGTFDGGHVGTLSAGAIGDEFKKYLNRARKAPLPALQALDFQYKGRAGMGLYLFKGTTCFRNVTVVPTTETGQPLLSAARDSCDSHKFTATA